MKPSSSTTDASTRGREAGCPVSGNKVINCCMVLDFIGAKFNRKYRKINEIKQTTCLLVLGFYLSDKSSNKNEQICHNSFKGVFYLSDKYDIEKLIK